MKKKTYTYTMVHVGDTTIAISSFGGKTVKGYAKNHPEDSYDEATGDKLAQARCGLKVAKKRTKWATKKYEEAKRDMIAAIGYFNKMEAYAKDSIEAQLDAEDYLKELMDTIEKA